MLERDLKRLRVKRKAGRRKVMGLKEKLASAQNSDWVTEGLEKSEVKSIVELAKISASIERCRLDLHMTQRQFAEYMGVSQGMVSKWESRDYNFTINSLNEICEKLNLVFNVSLSKPLSETDYNIIPIHPKRKGEHGQLSKWKDILSVDEEDVIKCS